MKDQMHIALRAALVVLGVGLVGTLIVWIYISAGKANAEAQDAKVPGHHIMTPSVPGRADAAPAETSAAAPEASNETRAAETVSAETKVPQTADGYDVIIRKLSGLSAPVRAVYEAEFGRYLEIDENLHAGVYTDALAKAQAAYDAWDAELNAIYRQIKSRMNEQRFEELRNEERAWLKVRDKAAQEASEGLSGDAAQEAELLSLTESTRSRTYELLAIYVSLLNEEDTQELPSEPPAESTEI